MRRQSKLTVVSLALSGIFLNGCGSNSTGGGNAAVTSLSAIPTATGPVVSSRSKDENQSAINSQQSNNETRPWVSMKASDWSNNTWTGKSAPLCDAGNQVAQLFRDASQPDKILCYISAMETGGLFTGDNYDNTWKYYEVQNVPSRTGRASLKVKFKIQKGSNGGIVDFKMFTADAARTDRVCSNGEFIHADLSSGATITTVYSGEHGKARIQATGTLNSEGKWSSKQITANNFWSNGSFDSGNYSVLNQYSDYLTLSGSMIYNHSGGTNQNQIYSKIALVNADNFANLEFGAGSTKMQSDWNGGGADFQAARSWSSIGDRILSTSGAYYNDVSGATLSEVKSTNQISTDSNFTSGETWDCTADEPGSSFAQVNFASGSAAAGIAACNAKFGDGGQWTNCYGVGAYYNDIMSVTSMSPTSGPVGTSFVISGTGFQGDGGINVTVGGQWASCSSFSDTSLTCQAPAGAGSGAQPVVVNVGSENVSAGSFTYP